MSKLLLFDSDILVYRCGFSADSEAKKEWGNEKYLDMDYPEKALGNTKSAITGTLEKLEANAEDCKFFLTGAGNFRDKIATIKPYKGNRDPTHKPKYYKEIRDYLMGVWKAELIEGHEADDALAMAQWACPDRSTCIVTIDKDLNMIPGWHYNWVKEEMFDVSISDANRNFYWQMLVGDTTDNIPGIRGVGPKTADKLLRKDAEEAEWKGIVKDLYYKEYGPRYEEALREIAMLLWMWRKPNDSPPDF